MTHEYKVSNMHLYCVRVCVNKRLPQGHRQGYRTWEVDQPTFTRQTVFHESIIDANNISPLNFSSRGLSSPEGVTWFWRHAGERTEDDVRADWGEKRPRLVQVRKSQLKTSKSFSCFPVCVGPEHLICWCNQDKRLETRGVPHLWWDVHQ